MGKRGRYQYPLENKARRLGTQVDPNGWETRTLQNAKSHSPDDFGKLLN